MRTGTWNVEYAEGEDKNARRLRLLKDVDCDIWVLTETNDVLQLGAGYTSASTTPRMNGRLGARWTTIWSRLPIIQHVAVVDDNRTVAALIDSPVGPIIVFGTVMPWHSDRGRRGAVARNWTEHHRVIPEQAREWAHFVTSHPDAALRVAGDFNMNLGGKHYYGTHKGRELLREGLKRAGLACLTDADRVPAAWWTTD